MRCRVVGAIVVCVGATASVATAQDGGLFGPVAWLAGCWAGEGQEGGTVEQWMAPAGGTMLGMSRTVRNGRTTTFEFMQLRAGAGGELTYIALPSGQRETHFGLRQHDADGVVFENPGHDFPQRILYRRQGEQGLQARIEGLRGGTLRGIDFPMRRVACP